jgi:hypothetical protein
MNGLISTYVLHTFLQYFIKMVTFKHKKSFSKLLFHCDETGVGENIIKFIRAEGSCDNRDRKIMKYDYSIGKRSFTTCSILRLQTNIASF